MTSAEIEAAKRLFRLVTPGEWDYRDFDECIIVRGNNSKIICSMRENHLATSTFTESPWADAWFITKAREGWPKAITELEKAREQLLQCKCIRANKDA